MKEYTTLKDQKKILKHLRISFQKQKMTEEETKELGELIKKLKNDIEFFEEQEENYKNQIEQERNLWK